MNIPIYRGLKLGTENEYVEGFYIEDYGIASYIQESKYLNFIVSDRGEKGMEVDTLFQIDPTTLAIHLPDMIDSQGKEIFASLDRYYLKGADILENDSFLGDYSIHVAIYSEGCFYAQDKDGDMYNLCENWEKLKVIGIQE